jgi:hypothetical protein
MPRDYRRGQPTTDQHAWDREVRKQMPVMVCTSCGYVWWPDRAAPTKPCKTSEGTGS